MKSLEGKDVKGEEGVEKEGEELEGDAFLKQRVEDAFLSLQNRICEEAESADGSGKTFIVDKWLRGENGSQGYGITRVLEGGGLLEKAAANISIIRGTLSADRAKAMSARGRDTQAGAEYFAAALSLVFHPLSPLVPTFRSDVRFFQVDGSAGWFGGGADLTPCYLFEEDAREFHAFYKAICDKYDPSIYARFKTNCDDYFYLPTRREHRGTGGIFFDDLGFFSSSSETAPGVPSAEASGGEPPEEAMERVFSFVRDVGEGFMPSFLPIAARRRGVEYGEEERNWQLLRRGRYLEFNLLHDRGVKFGLVGGRMESIMVSAPPLVAWKYNVVPEEGSREAELLQVLKEPRNWVK